MSSDMFTSVHSVIAEKGSCVFKLPITNFSDLKVTMTLEFHKRNNDTFRSVFNLFSGEKDIIQILYTNIYDRPNSVAEVKYVFDNIKALLQKLVFNKFEAKFVERESHAFTNEMVDMFSEFNEDMECIVCYDRTTSMTHCGHRLCIPCRQRVTNRKCPYCQTNIAPLSQLINRVTEEMLNSVLNGNVDDEPDEV